MNYAILIGLLTLLLHTKAQKMGESQAREDLQFLMSSIEKYNPALSHYHPEYIPIL